MAKREGQGRLDGGLADAQHGDAQEEGARLGAVREQPGRGAAGGDEPPVGCHDAEPEERRVRRVAERGGEDGDDELAVEVTPDGAEAWTLEVYSEPDASCADDDGGFEDLSLEADVIPLARRNRWLH